MNNQLKHIVDATTKQKRMTLLKSDELVLLLLRRNNLKKNEMYLAIKWSEGKDLKLEGIAKYFIEACSYIKEQVPYICIPEDRSLSLTFPEQVFVLRTRLKLTSKELENALSISSLRKLESGIRANREASLKLIPLINKHLYNGTELIKIPNTNELYQQNPTTASKYVRELIGIIEAERITNIALASATGIPQSTISTMIDRKNTRHSTFKKIVDNTDLKFLVNGFRTKNLLLHIRSLIASSINNKEYTLYNISKKAKLSTATIYGLLNGKDLLMSTLEKICDCLELNIELERY